MRVTTSATTDSSHPVWQASSTPHDSHWVAQCLSSDILPVAPITKRLPQQYICSNAHIPCSHALLFTPILSPDCILNPHPLAVRLAQQRHSLQHPRIHTPVRRAWQAHAQHKVGAASCCGQHPRPRGRFVQRTLVLFCWRRVARGRLEVHHRQRCCHDARLGLCQTPCCRVPACTLQPQSVDVDAIFRWRTHISRRQLVRHLRTITMRQHCYVPCDCLKPAGPTCCQAEAKPLPRATS